jgi:NitT/TauT family transport system ATP-binding protein
VSGFRAASPTESVKPATAPPSPGSSGLRAHHLTLGYKVGRHREFTVAVAAMNLEIQRGEFAVIVGPSGCGKSTFLEAVAGLVPVNGGELTFGGQPILGPDKQRSLVFQQASLFPWRNVRENVAYGLLAQRRHAKEDRERVEHLIDLVGLREHAAKVPQELSGGMRQRVNLARALATDPDLLLLDEPFGALDAMTRSTLQEELLQIWQSDDGRGEGKTALFITHDVAESVLLADRVFVFSRAPAHVAHEVKIDVPRPRDASWKRSAQFTEYCDELLEALQGGNPSGSGGGGR